MLQMIEKIAVKEHRTVLHILVGTSKRCTVGLWCQRTELTHWWSTARLNETQIEQDKLAAINEAPIYYLDAHGYVLSQLVNSVDAFAKGSNQLGLIYIQGTNRLNI